MNNLSINIIGKSYFWTCLSIGSAFLHISSSSICAEEKFILSRKSASLEDVMEKLMVDAFSYSFSSTKENTPSGYRVLFEHWSEGELKQVRKTQVFRFDLKDSSKDSFFISFPVPPRMDVLVLPSGGNGEFREVLPFKVSSSKETTRNYIEKIIAENIDKNKPIVLGYLVIGMSHQIELEVKRDEKNTLQSEVEAYKEVLMQKKVSDSDLIVYKLIFE